MTISHGVGDFYSKFVIEFYCIFYLSLVFFLSEFLQLHKRLFFKG